MSAALTLDQRGIAMHVHAIEYDLHSTSQFWSAVRDARAIAHRDLDTGAEVTPQPRPEERQVWPASLIYMVLLDQIGSSLVPVGAKGVNAKSGFVLALKHFGKRLSSPLSDQDIDTLYGLRNSFAHDYSLVNLPPLDAAGKPVIDTKTGRARLANARAFSLVRNRFDKMITDPNTPWDGVLDRPDLKAFVTTVNLLEFENLAERIIGLVQDLARKGELEMAKGLDAKTFNARFSTFVTVAT